MIEAAFTLQLADTPAGSPSVATVSGEVDVTNAEDFSKSLRALSDNRPVVVDLSPLRYLDSAGFAVLDSLVAERTVSIVIAPESSIHKAAALMELPFYRDTDSALRSSQAGG